ncbi:endonuclease I [Candidatus Riesia sp. GBBU]|nr:endonuclease I [Candidatus Riesia sp. GBBU]
MKFLFLLLILFACNNLSYSHLNLRTAKKIAKEKIFFDQFDKGDGTIYCGCKWEWTKKNNGKVNLSSCNFPKRTKRSQIIEWEHIVPVWKFGHNRDCWKEGGRKNCSIKDPVFREMESNLYNLVPSIGKVNNDRKNFKYGIVRSKHNKNYGDCKSKIDLKKKVFEPRDDVKGQIARIVFYMHYKYNLMMTKKQQKLFLNWDKKFPVSKWEILKNNRISKFMGHKNKFVTGEIKWIIR